MEKKYRPLGRWNSKRSVNNPLLILCIRQTLDIDTYLKTDPARRICISHYGYSELTVHKGTTQFYRFIIEIATVVPASCHV
jgi:hypothetical protein